LLPNIVQFDFRSFMGWVLPVIRWINAKKKSVRWTLAVNPVTGKLVYPLLPRLVLRSMHDGHLVSHPAPRHVHTYLLVLFRYDRRPIVRQ
jgi:hypothetical protein